MKSAVSVLLFVFLSFSDLSSQSAINGFEIKSLNVYTTDNQTSLPVLTNRNKLVIEFDVQGDFFPNMNIVFRFCDKGWTPTKNVFLLNSQYSTYYFLDFEELPIMVVDDARYHHKCTYPDDRDQVQFPFSGKWRFYLTDTQDSSIVYATGKFFVVNEDVELNSRLKRDELEDKSYWPVELANSFNITTDLYLPDEFHPSFVDKIEIIDNQRIYYPVIIDRNTNTLFRYYKWDANRSFTFTARDIPAGNEFRQVDIRDNNKFIGRDVKAQLDGLEYSRFFLNPLRKDLNGGKIFSNYKDEFSTYLNITFSIRPPDEVINDIFLVGAFNDWKLSMDYKMNESEGVYSITIPLKRGIYDYQYVSADVENGDIINTDWLVLEGNTWINSKEFDVFLYYNEQDQGPYERIIGYKRISQK
ncbi:MAG: type IX secretion system plug protein domain-containing protein [Ignavibacteriales bacterium]